MPIQLLTITEQRQVVPIGVEGEPVIELHQQLSRILANRTSDKHCGQFLAKPVVDSGNGNISWYTRLEGPVRRLQDLGEAERQSADQRLEDVIARIATVIKALETSDRGDQQRLASQLSAAMKHPGAGDFYLVGAQPVLVNWACTPGGARAAAADLMAPGRATPHPKETAVALPQQSWRKRRKLGWLLLVPLLLLPLYLRRCQEVTLPPCEGVLPLVQIIYDSSGSMAFPLRMPEQLVNDYADDYLRERAQQTIYQSLEGQPPAALEFGRRFLAPGAGEQFPGKLDWVRQNLQDEIERFGSPRALLAREAVEQLEKSFVGGMKYTPIVFTDCDSIDGPVDSLQQGQLANAATVLDYEPGNASPVAGSLAALEEFMSNGDVDDNVAAIMFSDGVESCGGDPCARARQLQQEFPNLSVNILHLGPETYSSCIAEATGGKQYPLDDLAGLVADIRAMATVSTTQSECSLAEKAE